MNLSELPSGPFQVITVDEPNEALDETERELKELLVQLQRSYQASAEPIIQRLCRISEFRKRRYYIVPQKGLEP